jgi:hypothetical protein
MIAMSMPRVPVFQPRVDANQEGSRVDVLAQPGQNGSQLAPIYGDEQRNNGGGQDAEDQLARLLAGADSGQIRAWAGNISQQNARKSLEFFPNTSPLKYIGPYAQPATYQSLTLSEVNRRRFGAYVPWVDNQGNDMTPLAGNRIIVAGDPFSLKNGVVDSNNEDAIPVEWQNQMDGEWRQVQLNMGPAGAGSYNRQHLAMGRFSMTANPHQSSSTLLPT